MAAKRIVLRASLKARPATFAAQQQDGDRSVPQKGILFYRLTLDVKHRFGANNYTRVDNVECLPEPLPALPANLMC